MLVKVHGSSLLLLSYTVVIDIGEFIMPLILFELWRGSYHYCIERVLNI